MSVLSTVPQILALDVDGVIIEGFPNKQWDETLQSDLGISPEEIVERFFKPYWHTIMCGEVLMYPTLERVLRQMGSKAAVDDLVSYWHGKDAHVREDVIEACKEWRSRTGGTIILATNQEAVRASYLWLELGFKDHFDQMIVSCEIRCAKPDPRYFAQADKLVGRRSGQMVFFLDDLEENVAAAAAHGWQAHHVEEIDRVAEMLQQLG